MYDFVRHFVIRKLSMKLLIDLPRVRHFTNKQQINQDN